MSSVSYVLRDRFDKAKEAERLHKSIENVVETFVSTPEGHRVLHKFLFLLWHIAQGLESHE